MTKTLFLLNIDNYAPEITAITYPLIELYADRIGAKIHTIKERKFPAWPVTYEKLQIYELAREIGSDWNLYIDSDTLIHPECPDYTIFLPMGTVSFHAADVSWVRFKKDDVSLRDGRYLAPGNWFMIGSRLCLDLWRPLEVTPAEAIAQIFPTPNERLSNIKAEHLVDDYALAHNMARFGLRFKSFVDINKEYGFQEYLYHQYTLDALAKVLIMKKTLEVWKCEHYLTEHTEANNGVLHAAGYTDAHRV
jgi:hypothetical protein